MAQHIRPRHLPTQSHTCTFLHVEHVYKLSFLPLKNKQKYSKLSKPHLAKGELRSTHAHISSIHIITHLYESIFFVYQAFYVPAQTIKVLYFITFYLSTSYIKIISTECVLNKINKSFLFVFRF